MPLRDRAPRTSRCRSTSCRSACPSHRTACTSTSPNTWSHRRPCQSSRGRIGTFPRTAEHTAPCLGTRSHRLPNRYTSAHRRWSRRRRPRNCCQRCNRVHRPCLHMQGYTLRPRRTRTPRSHRALPRRGPPASHFRCSLHQGPGHWSARARRSPRRQHRTRTPAGERSDQRTARSPRGAGARGRTKASVERAQLG